MKYCFLSFLLLFVLSTSNAQTLPDKNQVPSNIAACRSVIIHLGDSLKRKDTLTPGLFRSFEVIDERADTARLGLHSDVPMFSKLRSRQVVFGKKTSQEIAGYLNAHFGNTRSGYTALIVVRTLWLSDANYIHEDLVKTDDPDFHKNKTRIRFKAEVYAAKDNKYIPLFRYDSAHYFQKISFNGVARDIAEMLANLADSASAVLSRKEMNGRQISLDDIKQFNRTRFDAPICTNNPPLVKGVYKTFEEFKNNQPSITDFEIKKEKDNNILYIKEAGKDSYYSHDTWGYCDGRTVYIMKEGTLIPAWREGNAWYLFGRIETEHFSQNGNETHVSTYSGTPSSVGTSFKGTSVGVIAPTIIINTIPKLYKTSQKSIFTVDMDSGKLY